MENESLWSLLNAALANCEAEMNSREQEYQRNMARSIIPSDEVKEDTSDQGE